MLTLILLCTLATIITLFLAGIRIIRPTHRGLVETLGSYTRFAGPGFNWIIPVFENLITVDITEQMIESGERQMITNDNLNATIDAIIFYKVKSDEQSVKNSEYAVAAYEDQIIALTKTALRNIIGTMTLKSANSERNRINSDLQALLSKETAGWGIEVVRAELKEIDPPEDVQETMNKVVKAENEKIAALDTATALETKADGEKRAAIKAAEGRAESIKIENEAANKYFTGNAVMLRKLEVVEKSLSKNTKIIMQPNTPLIGLLDGLIKD